MLERLQSLGKTIKDEIVLDRLLIKDQRTPKLSKILLWIAVGYVLLPFDLIPDFIHIIGHLNDALMIPALVLAAFKMIPTDVVDDCRLRATDLSAFHSNTSKP